MVDRCFLRGDPAFRFNTVFDFMLQGVMNQTLFSSVFVCGCVALSHWARRLQRDTTEAQALAARRFQLSELLVRIFGEPLPRDPDSAYCFLQVDANVESVVSAAAKLASRYPGMRLVVVNVENAKLTSPIQGFAGSSLFLRRLSELGIPESRIDLVDFDYEHNSVANTLTESEVVVRHAKDRGYQSMIVAAPSFHLVRGVMTMASVAMREYTPFRIFPCPGEPLPWDEESRHSQGMVGTRAEFIESDLSRIERYTAKGDIESWDRVASFLSSSATSP